MALCFAQRVRPVAAGLIVARSGWVKVVAGMSLTEPSLFLPSPAAAPRPLLPVLLLLAGTSGRVDAASHPFLSKVKCLGVVDAS